jgi:hypothetical protein
VVLPEVDDEQPAASRVISPQSCVIPAGRQQQFTVSFSSLRSGQQQQQLVLRGCQQLLDGEATAASSSCNEEPVRLSLLPAGDGMAAIITGVCGLSSSPGHD